MDSRQRRENAAYVFADDAEEYKQQFLDYGMDAGFIADLRAKADAPGNHIPPPKARPASASARPTRSKSKSATPTASSNQSNRLSAAFTAPTRPSSPRRLTPATSNATRPCRAPDEVEKAARDVMK